jgi:hypothetical protein
MAEEYVEQFVDTLRLRAGSRLRQPKEPRKRIRKIYISDEVKNSRPARVPMTEEQKHLQKHAREVAEASRCKGHPKHY